MRVLRGLLRALVVTVVLLVGAGTAAAVVSQTAWFRNWLRGFIVTQSSQFLNGELSIGRLDGNLIYGIELGDVAISMDGQPVISLQDVVVHYNAWQLVTRGISIDELRIFKPQLTLRAGRDGWQIARLLKKQEQEADRQGPERPFSVKQIVVADGNVAIDGGDDGADAIPRSLEGLSLVAAFAYEPVRYSFTIESLSLRSVAPDLNVRSLAGSLAVKDDTVYVDQVSLQTDASALTIGGEVQHYLSRPVLNVQASVPQLSLAEIGRFVPALTGIDLQPSIEVRLDGPLDALKVGLSTQSSAGSIKAALLADLQTPGQAVSGDLSVQHLDLAPLLKDRSQKSDMTGDLKVDLSGESFAAIDSLHGTVSGNARVGMAGYVADRLDLQARLTPHAPAMIDAQLFAYGARATAAGTVSFPDGRRPVTFDLRGRAERVNVRALPPSLGAPRVTTDLNASYHVAGAQPTDQNARRRDLHLAADIAFSRSSLPGVRVEAGSTARVNVDGRAIAYKTDATVADLDLREIGRAFNVPALADDRYHSTIGGRIVAAGRGTEVATIDVDATGTITSAELMGGRVSDLQFSGGLHQDNARVDANGAFDGFDPAVLSGKPAAQGRVAGNFAVHASIDRLSSGVTLDNAAGDARVTLLPSTVGGLTIDRASLDASYEQRSAAVRELSVVGRDANLSASGVLALGDTGESTLMFHADSPRLAEVGRIVDIPLTGIARLDGTLGGNRRELTAKGTLEGDGLQYQENGALALRSQFTAKVPDFDAARISADADSRATFVTLAGQNLNEVTAKTAYESDRVSFDLIARQPQRQLDAAGAVTLHTDHQEIHLDRLALQAANQRWQVPDGETPTINYGGSAIAVERFRLTNGDQEITADGRFGAPGDALNVRLTNVDLAAVDALLLRPPQFGGRLAATGTVSGTTGNPAVTANVEVTAGSFRQFKYETLSGQVEYTKDGITLDTRLQQNATQWITAKGHLPATLLQPAASDDAAAASTAVNHVLPSTAADRVDLTINSSPLGLGLLQGFTTSLSNVDGTIEAHVRVTGSAADPHPEGTLTIADGMMTVVPNGVTYTNITGKVELQPERVHIEQITVLDNHQSALSITGDLAVHAGEVGGVQLWLNASDFKVLDNKMGNVRVNSAIEIAGDLRSPFIQGDFGISTGRVDLDELMALAGPSAYSTTPTEYLTPETIAKAATAKEPPAPSVFDALRMNLRLQVPDDLVIKANALQAPGATVSLGALNMTLGGDLVATKNTRGPVRIAGQVNTVRGTYDFQGRRFDILRDGTVRFDGGDTLNPILDIRTRREIQGVEALVTVRGTLDRPQVILSSTPRLEDADILSLIVFNQPINQLGEGAQVSLSERAQSLAAGAVIGQLSASIGNALKLDTFEINLGPENGAAAELTLGQQLGKDLYLKVQQGVGELTSTNVIIEYAFAHWLRLQTNILQGASSQQSLFRRQQGSGADLIVLFTR